MKTIVSALVLLVSVCSFSELSFAGPIRRVLQDSKALQQSTTRPIAVFDLDETLVYTAARRLLAYRFSLPTLQAQYPAETQKALKELRIEQLTRQQNLYSARELFHQLAITNNDFISAADKAMLPAYLNNQFMDFDVEMPCAAKFVNALQRNGVLIAYVSSRALKDQYQGTIQSLARIGLPAPNNKNVFLYLRPEGQDSLSFKRESFSAIQKLGQNLQINTSVRYVFENEPENLNAMIDIFEGAYPFFIHGAQLKALPLQPKGTSIQHLRNYCD